jgi:hypothetical protein
MHVAGRKSRTTRSSLTRRTQLVWMCFLASVTVVCGVLALADDGITGGFLTAHTTLVSGSQSGSDDPICNPPSPIDRTRWNGIVIHHSGQPAGDGESMHRLHLSYGYSGLGYHFIIGNGNGLGDGVIHVGYRWSRQLPGVHTAGPLADQHNKRSIGICLIGNGDRRSFTPRQLEQLITLVQRLQRELDISAERVYLQSELGTGSTSPGQLFPAAQFREMLLR